MHILVTWGSKRGGTQGIARIVAEALREEGHTVDEVPAEKLAKLAGFDAVIVGGALYANRWHRAARRFVSRREEELRRVPVWFFSSGPLDDSPARSTISPAPQVESLMERVGAQGHVTFGGRLLENAHGFPASAMAKKHAGDWRNPERVRAWASAIARALPAARPGAVIEQPGRGLARLFAHGLAGWMLCAATMAILTRVTSLGAALVLHAFLAPVIFGLVARRYFRARGARGALTTAVVFTGMVALLDLIVIAGFVQRSLALFGSFLGSWLPFALIFSVTLIMGESLSMLPPPKRARN